MHVFSLDNLSIILYHMLEYKPTQNKLHVDPTRSNANTVHDRSLQITSLYLFHFRCHSVFLREVFQRSLFSPTNLRHVSNLSSSDTFPFTPYHLSLTRRPQFSHSSAIRLSLEISGVNITPVLGAKTRPGGVCGVSTSEITKGLLAIKTLSFSSIQFVMKPKIPIADHKYTEVFCTRLVFKSSSDSDESRWISVELDWPNGVREHRTAEPAVLDQ